LSTILSTTLRVDLSLFVLPTKTKTKRNSGGIPNLMIVFELIS